MYGWLWVATANHGCSSNHLCNSNPKTSARHPPATPTCSANNVLSQHSRGSLSRPTATPKIATARTSQSRAARKISGWPCGPVVLCPTAALGSGWLWVATANHGCSSDPPCYSNLRTSARHPPATPTRPSHQRPFAAQPWFAPRPTAIRRTSRRSQSHPPLAPLSLINPPGLSSPTRVTGAPHPLINPASLSTLVWTTFRSLAAEFPSCRPANTCQRSSHY